MRRSIVVVSVLLAIALLFIGGPALLVSPTTSEIAPETESDTNPDMVRPTDGESGFWP